jgi:hypothetical protein
MQDLSSVITTLNVSLDDCSTTKTQQQLQLMASEASDSQKSLVQMLDRVNQQALLQGLQELQVKLEGLLGGQAGLMLQLASGDDAGGVWDGEEAAQ